MMHPAAPGTRLTPLTVRNQQQRSFGRSHLNPHINGESNKNIHHAGSVGGGRLSAEALSVAAISRIFLRFFALIINIILTEQY